MANKLVEIHFSGKDFSATGWYQDDKKVVINKGSVISKTAQPSLCSGGLAERKEIEKIIDNDRKLIKDFVFKSSSSCYSAISGSNDGPRSIMTKEGMSLRDFLLSTNCLELSEIEENGTKYKHSKNFEEDQKKIKQIKKDWDIFLKRFPKENIQNISLIDYCEGTKYYKNSFSYILERGPLAGLGSIRNSTADKKFGIYFKKEINDYKFADKWGANKDEAFSNIKTAITELIKAGEKDDIEGIINNPLSEMYKSKLYFVYFPEKTIPVNSVPHLNFFLKSLRIDCELDKTDSIVKRSLLVNYKNNSPVFSDLTNLEFMYFLYSEFGFKKETTIMKKGNEYGGDNNLGEQTIELVDISGLENKEKGKAHSDRRAPKADFVLLESRKIKAGEDAEEKVLLFEKAINKKYKNEITRMSCDSDSDHYDIKSFDENGNEKHIEVKTKSSGSLNDVDFHISSNELQRLREDPCYVIYYVVGMKTNKVQIVKITPQMLDAVELVPDSYHIKARAIEKLQ